VNEGCEHFFRLPLEPAEQIVIIDLHRQYIPLRRNIVAMKPN
jgi:hypothetical protein